MHPPRFPHESLDGRFEIVRFLTIKGEKREEKEEKERNYHLSERLYGAFERSFEMPEGVDTEKVEARFDKGVLKITLPKKPEALKKEKKIEIKTG
jgi:HSP20 family protein